MKKKIKEPELDRFLGDSRRYVSYADGAKIYKLPCRHIEIEKGETV